MLPSSNQVWTVPPSQQWNESKNGERTLKEVLSRFQRTLRFVHKHKVTWPEEDKITRCVRSSDTTLSQIMDQIHLLVVFYQANT